MRNIDGMTLEKLQVIVEAQTKQYTDAMKKVQTQTTNTTKKVESQVSKIKNAFKKVALVLGITLSVAAIASFGKACIELGSDLEEVQNVVDVTFRSLSEQVNQFAKGAIEQFGLSELSAKKYASTMGAMLKSMGFTTDAAADMSMALTGLAGDIASFYNLSGDEAFTKIRSGISGETEPLKQLGINLSVANLEAFALTQGMNKAYNSMTQQEQALLRYNYLLSVTTDAQGDFARTSDSWANQTKILAERFNQVKASIGQGLINVLLPVIKVLNQLISKIAVAADAFKRFTEILTGKVSTSTSSSFGGITDSTDDATSSVGDLTDATNETGKAAKKAKEAYSGIAGFDEVNTLNKNDNSGAGGGAASTSTGGESGLINDIAGAVENNLNPVLQKVINKMKELQNIFKEGFKSGLGDVNFDGIKKAINGIKKSFIEIFTDTKVVNAADNCAKAIVYSIGQITGAMASIGITIATNLLGGINKYLEQNKDRIKNFVVKMFDVNAEIATITGNFAQAFANIFSVFGGENAQRVTAAVIGVFSNTAMAAVELFAKLGRDILNVLTKPFIDNQEKFKTAIDGYLGTLATKWETFKGNVDHTFDGIKKLYDKHIKPMFDSFANGLSSITEKILDVYQKYFQPVLDKMAEKYKEFSDSHLKPFIDKVLGFIGKVVDAVKDIWEKTLVPFINWIIENIVPVLAPILETAHTLFLDLCKVVTDVAGKILDALGGLVDFIAGVFTGDWKKAWNGIKTFFSGIWDAIKAIVSGAWNLIKSIVSGAINIVKNVIETVLNAIKSIFTTIFEAIKQTVTTVFEAIKSKIITTITNIKSNLSTILEAIKTKWNIVWNSIKTTVATIFNSIKTTITTVFTAVKTTISTILDAIKTKWSTVWEAVKATVTNIFEAVKSTISTTITNIRDTLAKILDAIKTKWDDVWGKSQTKVSTVFSGVQKKISDTITTIKNSLSGVLGDIKGNWDKMWGDMGTKVKKIFENIWSAIKGTIGSIIKGIETMANSVVKGVNKVIESLNKLSFKIPDWVPGYGGKSWGMNIPTIKEITIPPLAKGGIVNHATLAMIGEAGKEVVMPLENNTGWLDQIAARVGEIISVNLQGLVLQGGDSGETLIKTYVKLDTKTLVEQTDTYIKRKGREIVTT